MILFGRRDGKREEEARRVGERAEACVHRLQDVWEVTDSLFSYVAKGGGTSSRPWNGTIGDRVLMKF